MENEKSDTSDQLARVVGTPGAIGLGLGSILGTGVFVSLGVAAGIIGPGLLVAVALAALVATANGLSSAQLAAAHPVSGGTYEYGHRYLTPIAGFSAGWMYLVAKSASAATAALGCAGYLLHTLGVTNVAATRIGVGLVLVLGITVWIAGGLKRSNTANTVIVALTIASLCAFVAFGLISVDFATLGARIGSPTLDSVVSAPSSLLHATALVFVAYTGYGRVATLGEEVRNPKHTIPRAIIATLLITMVLYIAVAAVALATVGAEQFANSTLEDAAPLEVVARTFNHPQVAIFVAIGAVTAMGGVLLNLVLGLSRVLLAMARRREMPAALDRVDAQSSSPRRAVWAIGGFTALLVLTGDVKTTWTFSAFTVLVYYGLTNLAALYLPPEDRRFPRVVSVFGLLSCVGLAFFVEWTIIVVGLLLLVVGFVIRALALKFQT